MNTLAVLIGFIPVNALAIYFYVTVGNDLMGLFFLFLNLVLASFLLGALRDDLGRGKGSDD